MQQEKVVRVGDVIECFKWHRRIVEKIRIISAGKFVNECHYNGNGYDIMLILKGDSGSTKMSFKDAPKKKESIHG